LEKRYLLKRILIADDHESVLRRVRAMIESQPGLEVCGDAVNGRETITKTAELKPDLVILDFAMPQLNGLNAASAIKTLLPNVPIIMFTMYSSVVMQEAEKSGITRVIDKAKSNDLVPAVEELLGTQNLGTQNLESHEQNHSNMYHWSMNLLRQLAGRRNNWHAAL
jgi:DNA-binding NarL/FixJ family response regulator